MFFVDEIVVVFVEDDVAVGAFADAVGVAGG